MIEFSTTPHSEDPTIQVVKVSGELNNDNSEYFFACIEELIQDGHTRLILDCGDLKYVSSMGLGSLMRTHARMRKQMGNVKIAALQDFVAETFRLVGFEKVLQLYSTVDDASRSFEGS